MTTDHPRRALALVSVLLVSLPGGAFAQTAPSREDIDDANRRVEQLDDRIAAAEGELETIEASLAGLDDELQAANASLAEADRVAREAQDAADRARAEADRTRRELAIAEAQLAANQERLTTFVRDAYKYGPQAVAPAMAAFERLTSADGPGEIGDTLHLLDVVLGQRTQVVAESTRLLEITAELTEQTRQNERRRRVDAEAAAAALDAAATIHAEVMAVVDRTDAAVRRQQQLVAELTSERSAASQDVDDLERAAREAAEAAEAAVTTTPIGGGLVSVGGITVAATLGPQLEALLEAARVDGIVLGGSGYRSPATTARLRVLNGCPDIYDSPASACRVPTARPGESMHERGLAVDFTYQERTICYPRRASTCSGNAAFDWLAANAARFGLQVLDTEAWHWSTNGA